ncbi:hypothetical protein [Curtobacterium sp. 9128]|uniref:hypothetical protein n=1 Tax=Curtobacterium sp. 9128 TaxID=1793722 RepID=UPI0016424B55|nr:hypothetical protein [Curtobacterium sp. 9128]
MSDSINTWGGTVSKGAAKPLFVVRRSWLASTFLVMVGGGALVIGILGAVVQSSFAPDLGGGIPAMLIGGGIVLLPFGLVFGRSRIRVYDERYDVRRALGRTRRRDVNDVHRLRFATQSNGSVTFVMLTGWNAESKKQFTVLTSNRGYAEFEDWLARHRPEQWAECERLGIPD